MSHRIFLSPPHMGGQELGFVHEAFKSNYIAPVGVQLELFEREFAHQVGAKYAVAVSSGTAALHLLLRYVGVGPGDEVFCSTLTFVASVNPVKYMSGTPVFVDSDDTSWNMDPTLFAEEIAKRADGNRLPKAVIVVHLYGQPADIDPIKRLCNRYNIALIEDAAEALGALYQGKAVGTFGTAGFYSFNGNKIITTSGGGMIVSDDIELVKKVRFWATQARNKELYYDHSEVGYNYRMSNVLAAIGRGQLLVLPDRIRKKREIFHRYQNTLAGLPGLEFMPEPNFGRSSRWLTCLTIDPLAAKTSRNIIIQRLEENNIESRPTWKPMHMQPLFRECQSLRGSVAGRLFQNGLCLPSGTNMTEDEQNRVIKIVRSCWP